MYYPKIEIGPWWKGLVYRHIISKWEEAIFSRPKTMSLASPGPWRLSSHPSSFHMYMWSSSNPLPPFPVYLLIFKIKSSPSSPPLPPFSANPSPPSFPSCPVHPPRAVPTHPSSPQAPSHYRRPPPRPHWRPHRSQTRRVRGRPIRGSGPP